MYGFQTLLGKSYFHNNKLPFCLFFTLFCENSVFRVFLHAKKYYRSLNGQTAPGVHCMADVKGSSRNKKQGPTFYNHFENFI